MSYYLSQGPIRKNMALSNRIIEINGMKGLFTEIWARFWKLNKGQCSTLVVATLGNWYHPQCYRDKGRRE